MGEWGGSAWGGGRGRAKEHRKAGAALGASRGAFQLFAEHRERVCILHRHREST